jgi:dihydropteroate synthase
MEIQILSVAGQKDIIDILREIGVDEGGIKIMSAKAITRLVRIKHIPSWHANILKQEILSLNGDVAINRGAITGKAKFTDCLIIGNTSQLNYFIEKLTRQPSSLKKIALEIRNVLDSYERREFVIPAKKSFINLGRRTLLMAVVNLTLDSFSGDGLLGKMSLKRIERYIEGLVKDGADIIDIGGESTRPGAKPISLSDEISRTIPVIKNIASKIKIPISIDTYKPEVARRALDAGASIVNNIKGTDNNPEMLKVIKKNSAAVVLMHIKGSPKTMQKKPHYKDLMGEIIASLKKSINTAVSKGIKREKIIIDPGIGFGKTLEQNLEIIRRLSELKSLGHPILVGPSRKSFIGKILNLPPEQRLIGTVASVVTAILNGANIVRVHDCRAIKEVAKITDSIIYN